ncbi:MAG: hypothetical protein ACRCVE_02390, partial [Plesiomonas sp.]
LFAACFGATSSKQKYENDVAYCVVAFHSHGLSFNTRWLAITALAAHSATKQSFCYPSVIQYEAHCYYK